MTKGLRFEMAAEALALGQPSLRDGAGIVSGLLAGWLYEISWWRVHFICPGSVFTVRHLALCPGLGNFLCEMHSFLTDYYPVALTQLVWMGEDIKSTGKRRRELGAKELKQVWIKRCHRTGHSRHL